MKKLFILFVIVLLAQSCSENTNDPDQNSKNVLIPLAIGNFWEYVKKDYFIDGIRNDSIIRRDTARFELISDTLFDGERFFAFGEGSHIETYWINREDGFYVYDDPEDSKPDMFLKFPGDVGDKFSNNENVIEILSVNKRRDLTCGSFTCYLYHDLYQGNNFTRESFVEVSPNIGIVYQEGLYKDADTVLIRSTIELINYQLER